MPRIFRDAGIDYMNGYSAHAMPEAGAENKNDPQQKQHDDQGDQPPLLFAGAKAQEFFEHRPHRPAQCSHPAGQCNSVELPVVVRFRF